MIEQNFIKYLPFPGFVSSIILIEQIVCLGGGAGIGQIQRELNEKSN